MTPGTQTFVKIQGKSFYCDAVLYGVPCGCNVFTVLDDLRVRCNGCDATYTGEKTEKAR